MAYLKGTFLVCYFFENFLLFKPSKTTLDFRVSKQKFDNDIFLSNLRCDIFQSNINSSPFDVTKFDFRTRQSALTFEMSMNAVSELFMPNSGD